MCDLHGSHVVAVADVGVHPSLVEPRQLLAVEVDPEAWCVRNLEGAVNEDMGFGDDILGLPGAVGVAA